MPGVIGDADQRQAHQRPTGQVEAGTAVFTGPLVKFADQIRLATPVEFEQRDFQLTANHLHRVRLGGHEA
ncbi:hypothetical protein D3C79_979530 [compost metagenome]